MEEISLINKLVKTSDGSVDNTGLIAFMYPSFIVKDEIFFDYENSIIYTGQYSKTLRDELSHGTKEFIAICNIGMTDIDFTDRGTNIDVLYSKWGKSVSDSNRELLMNMSDIDFWNFFKKYWVTGKSKIDEKDVSIYELYKVLGKQRHDIMNTYFKLLEVYSDSTIYSSVLGFIEKSLNPDSVSSQNGNYLKLLNDFRKSYGNAIAPIMQRAYIMGGSTPTEKQARTIWVLMQLGRGEL